MRGGWVRFLLLGFLVIAVVAPSSVLAQDDDDDDDGGGRSGFVRPPPVVRTRTPRQPAYPTVLDRRTRGNSQRDPNPDRGRDPQPTTQPETPTYRVPPSVSRPTRPRRVVREVPDTRPSGPAVPRVANAAPPVRTPAAVPAPQVPAPPPLVFRTLAPPAPRSPQVNQEAPPSSGFVVPPGCPPAYYARIRRRLERRQQRERQRGRSNPNGVDTLQLAIESLRAAENQARRAPVASQQPPPPPPAARRPERNRSPGSADLRGDNRVRAVRERPEEEDDRRAELGEEERVEPLFGDTSERIRLRGGDDDDDDDREDDREDRRPDPPLVGESSERIAVPDVASSRAPKKSRKTVRRVGRSRYRAASATPTGRKLKRRIRYGMVSY